MWTDETQEYPHHITWWMLSTFLRNIYKEKTSFISWNHAEKWAKGLKKDYDNKSFLRTYKYFEWTMKQLLNSNFLWCEELCR